MSAGAIGGVSFPAQAGGRRSSLAFGRGVLAAAAQPVAPALARAIAAESDWRRRYPAHVRALTAAGLAAPGAAVAIAAAGLAAIHDGLEFAGPGRVESLRAAMARETGGGFETVVVRGQGVEPPRLEVPYRGERLAGAALARQLDRWVAAQVVEPSFAAALAEVIDHPQWLDLSDWQVALLGAGAELGPYAVLARWRARLALVDLPRPALWRELLRLALAGNGELRVPVAAARAGCGGDLAERAGADLVAEAPQIARWLGGLAGPLAVGCHAYADGEAHVRVAAAMDAIVARLMDDSPAVVPACLLTPTDVHAVPAAAVAAARARWCRRGALARALGLASGGRFFAPNFPEADGAAEPPAGLVDALVLQQGPNYALAKRLQQWRALVALGAGRRASVHVAPAARTASVVANRALAAAYAGAHHFGVEIFEPACANALMAALLVHDLRRPPPGPGAEPAAAVMAGAAHGGLWRLPYAPRSALPFAALLGLAGNSARRAS